MNCSSKSIYWLACLVHYFRLVWFAGFPTIGFAHSLFCATQAGIATTTAGNVEMYVPTFCTSCLVFASLLKFHTMRTQEVKSLKV
jgi:hypothetical protein